jgi:hypothetical protein
VEKPGFHIRKVKKYGGYNERGANWLRGCSRAEKSGFIPYFWPTKELCAPIALGGLDQLIGKEAIDP